jgi:tetrathionate reductase subunit B
VDKALCIGCGYCVKACPYDARFIDPVARKVDKCDFCAPRVARGQQPACVLTCPAKAKRFGDLEDHSGDVFRAVYLEGAHRVESSQAAIGPNVYYLGRPEQLALLDTAFPPHAPQLTASGWTLKSLVKPAVVAGVGLAFLGQAAAFFLQLWNGEQDHE